MPEDSRSLRTLVGYDQLLYFLETFNSPLRRLRDYRVQPGEARAEYQKSLENKEIYRRARCLRLCFFFLATGATGAEAGLAVSLWAL